MSRLEDQFMDLWQAAGPKGIDLTTQYLFDPVTWSDREGHEKRRWRFDAAIPDHRIAIELEGFGLNHQGHAGFNADCEKYNTATSLGWRVLRFTANHLASRSWWVIEMIEATIHEVQLKEKVDGEEEDDRKAEEV